MSEKSTTFVLTNELPTDEISLISALSSATTPAVHQGISAKEDQTRAEDS